MSELLARFDVPSDVEEADDTVQSVAPAPAGVTHEPVLITEQQVRFATAAVPLQPAKSRGWVSRVMSSIASAASATSTNEGRPKRRHYPSRHDFLEDSRMAREMHRL